MIPKVVLPEGFPRPLVNSRLTRLDLPYQLRLRILPPCPEGNDQREPNNSAGKAARITVKSEQLLRICKGDVDWLEIEQKVDQDLQITTRYDFAHGALQMEAFDEQGSKSLGKARTAAPRLPGKTVSAKDDSPQARRGRTATTGMVVKGGKDKRVIKLRVKAADDVENFYILRVQEPPPPSDKGNKKQDKKNKKDDKKKKDKKKDKKQDPKKKEKKKDKEEKKKKKKKKKKDKRRQKQLREQMKRHDRNPKNLEAQEALRRSPFRNNRPTKDW